MSKPVSGTDKKPARSACLISASLDGNTRRAIDICDGEALDEKALKALIRAAIELNTRR